MRDRSIFFYIVSLVGVALGFVLNEGEIFEADATRAIIAVLAATVLVSVAFLFIILHKPAASCAATVCAFTLTAWAVGSAFLPMAAMAVLVVLGTLKLHVQIICAITVSLCFICALIFRPDMFVIISTALLLGFSVFILYLFEQRQRIEKSAESSENRAEDMRAILGSQRRMVKSTEHVSRLEERNRLAARIHDEIGHGMSGSILLLEGAELVMDKEPEKARETIRKVTGNLRVSVEKIRGVLRDERSASAEVNLARIEKELRSFETDHPHIKTKLYIEGDMDSVKGAVWTCIYENMIEALTNVLKHYSATLFSVSLKNSGVLLHIEFADNGGAGARKGDVKPGIGLQNMEERAALCYGRCFFRNEPDGFHIVMTFPRREG